MNNPGLHLFLRSNVAPNTCEAAFFRLQVDDLTSQISELGSRLAELEDQLQSYRAVLSPVRRMPVEVLGEIFVRFLPDVLRDGARNSLVDIQLVCKRWRDAARLTHSLWGALSFEDVTNVSYKKIKQWYNRAGGTPKSLVFSARGHNDCSEQSSCGSLEASALATILVNLEGTLDNLSLAYRGPKCFQNLLNSLGPAEPNPTTFQRRPWHPLKSFAIQFDEEWNESSDFLQSMFHRLPPDIMSLDLHLPHKWDAWNTDWESDSAPLPLPQNLLERLSSFTISCSWDGTRWLESALRHCVNVETLTMDFMGAYWLYDGDNPGTEHILNSGLLLPKVRTLRLQNVWTPSIDILRTLKAPQLVELDINIEPGDEDDDDESNWVDVRPLLSFIERSKCDATLRVLHLRNARIKSEELAATLGSLPSLTHLSLEGINMERGATFVDAFVVPKKNLSRLLPNLETLELLQLPPNFSKYRLFTFLKLHRPYRMENGQPLFSNPQDSFRRLKVVYQPTTKEKQELDGSDVVETLRKWGGVSFDIGPILYVD